MLKRIETAPNLVITEKILMDEIIIIPINLASWIFSLITFLMLAEQKHRRFPRVVCSGTYKNSRLKYDHVLRFNDGNIIQSKL